MNFYKSFLKPVLFSFDAEKVHDAVTFLGESLENILPDRNFKLEKEVLGIKFSNPIGLAAGFDYDGHLAQVMKSVGFGFNTVGTVTAKPYAGNPGVRLARLPKSQSLLVNKGFKSEGAKAISKRLDKKDLPGHTVGISVGSSNLPQVNTINKAVDDYLETLEIFRNKKYVSYFELNISCPNTAMSEGFAVEKNFGKLVKAVKNLKLKQPIFIKMPNEIDFRISTDLVRISLIHGIHGFIFSNLVKNRNNPVFDKEEMAKFANFKGNFSGKPAEKNANNLISQTRKKFGKEVAIIGLGGVFSLEDALEKFSAGADLTQLITGMIFEGPQLVGEINRGLAAR